ncbi:CKLF-like MARVEL transmembrane domain-containing protein 6 [Leptodactylus fuscus]|uniref:CKLF-like MARVEL transmembrane domain-containing protein 6 n=1 Tax=Leptodactylus fuscus TaxID=238119 RepID=UPI003F4E5755
MTEPRTYNPTTESLPKPKTFCGSELEMKHLLIKIAQLVLSFLAFILEEVIEQCDSCAGLYIFEFVSCSAFLLAILMLVVYWSPLKRKIVIPSFKKIDFWVTVAVGICFLIASIIFAATMDNNTFGKVSVAFGFLASFVFLLEFIFMYKGGYWRPQAETTTAAAGTNGTVEREPLNTPVQATA